MISWRRAHRGEGLAVLALTLLAAALRLWRLDAIPPGLHVDEAFNVLDARKVIDGLRPVFLTDNAGRDVLFTYLQAPLLALFGESAWSARLPSALTGALTVPAAWWAARALVTTSELSEGQARRIALATAALVAVSYWHLHFSRFGIRAVLFPLVVTAAMGLWWRTVTELRGGYRRWIGPLVALSVVLGLAFYTHPAGRALAVVPAAHAGYRWLRWRDGRPLGALLAAAAGMLAVAAPLLAFWTAHPWTFTSHAEDVSILGDGAMAVLAGAAKVAGMFNLAGDPAPWRNLPGRPAFDVLTGLAFVIGLVLAARSARRGDDWAALALIWLGVLLVPSVATRDAPNFSRAIGALPAACLVAAVGMVWVADAAARWVGAWRGSGGARLAGVAGGTLAPGILSAWLIVSGARTGYDYFVRWSADPDTPFAFDADKRALGEYYRRRVDEGALVYLSPAMMDHPSVVVAAGVRPSGYDPAAGLVIPTDVDRPVEYVTLDGEVEIRRRLDLRDAAPPAPATWAALPPAPAGAYTLHRHTVGPELRRMLVQVGDDDRGGSFAFPPYFRLVTAGWPEQVQAGEGYDVKVVWDAIGPSPAPMHTAIQLRGLDGAGLGHGDAPPLAGGYPTDRWRPGERIFARYRLLADPGAPAGPAEIRVGWYTPAEGDRPFEPLVLDARGTTVLVVGHTEVVRP